MDPSTFQIDLPSVRRAISSNTILMYSSAPTYPQGAIDPISKLSEIAVTYNIGLHVDCCLGGFVLPFAKKLGYSIPGEMSVDFYFSFFFYLLNNKTLLSAYVRVYLFQIFLFPQSLISRFPV